MSWPKGGTEDASDAGDHTPRAFVERAWVASRGQGSACTPIRRAFVHIKITACPSYDAATGSRLQACEHLRQLVEQLTRQEPDPPAPRREPVTGRRVGVLPPDR